MPTYVSLMNWTEQGVKTMKDSVSRSEQGRAAIEKFGGRVVASWWTQGAYDVVLVTEFPDDESASAAALAVGIAGNVRSQTMRAYGVEEMQRIIQKLS
jgi:uncharacterized protein with GYD domain